MKMSRKAGRTKIGFRSVIDIISLAVFGGIALKLVEKFELDRKAIEGNMHVHPVNLVARYFYYTFIAGIYIAFATIYIYPMIPKPYSIIVIIAIYMSLGFVPFIPIVKILNAVEENKGKVSRELPYFMFHLSILARTRLALSDILRRTSNSTIYPTISSYMNRILAISRTLGWDLLHAIEEVGISIPQKALSSTLIGFANVLRTKGNVSDFLERAMNLAMEDQRKYLDRLKSSVSMLAMMYSVVMMTILFLNILQVTSATGKLAISLGIYAMTSIVLIPLLSFLVLWMVYLKIPKMDTPSKKPLYMFLGWLPIGVLVGYIVSESFASNPFSGPIGSSMALAVPSFAATYTFNKLHANDEALIRKFTDFLHDIASERRLGIPLEQILLNMGEIYGPLNKPLRVLKMGIRTGMPLRLSIALAFSQVKSKTIRFMALLLSDAIVLGSATEETFNFMERMVKELVDVIDSMRSELRSISLTPYIIIIIEVVGIAFFITINPVSLVNNKIHGTLLGNHINQTNIIQVSQYFAYGTVLTSFIGAFIIGLLRKQNPWAGFFHAGLILALIATTLLLTPHVNGGTFMPG